MLCLVDVNAFILSLCSNVHAARTCELICDMFQAISNGFCRIIVTVVEWI